MPAPQITLSCFINSLCNDKLFRRATNFQLTLRINKVASHPACEADSANTVALILGCF
jgi:hypothetical protein